MLEMYRLHLSYQLDAVYGDARVRAVARNELRVRARNFSTEAMEEHIIRPLAKTRGLLPQSFDYAQMETRGYREQPEAQRPDSSELLRPAVDDDGYVRASQPRYQVMMGTSCKCLALLRVHQLVLKPKTLVLQMQSTFVSHV